MAVNTQLFSIRRQSKNMICGEMCKISKVEHWIPEILTPDEESFVILLKYLLQNVIIAEFAY